VFPQGTSIPTTASGAIVGWGTVFSLHKAGAVKYSRSQVPHAD